MFNLPTDIIDLILSDVSHKDVINLSVLNKPVREAIEPYLWQKVKSPWFRIIDNEDYHAEFTRELRIIDCYSFGEWHYNLSKTIERSNHLSHLLINSNSSSGWLKYIESEQLKALTLYYCSWHNETRLKMSNTPVAVLHPNHPRFFNVSSIVGFKGLTRLTLHDYTFNWEDTETVSLKELLLIDCRWDYPFKLTSFNCNLSLKKLELHYSTCNAFILSERLNMFLVDETAEIFASISDLTIGFYKRISVGTAGDSTWEKHLNHRVFHKFISQENYPNLKKLRLFGWFSNVPNLNHYLRQITWNGLVLMELELIHNFVSELENVKEDLRRFPNMELDLVVHREHSVYHI